MKSRSLSQEIKKPFVRSLKKALLLFLLGCVLATFAREVGMGIAYISLGAAIVIANYLSRIPNGIKPGSFYEGKDGDAYKVVTEDGLTLIVPQGYGGLNVSKEGGEALCKVGVIEGRIESERVQERANKV